MQAGNAHYRTANDLPHRVPVFPLAGALLLPAGRMPLNIFEPRYLQMIDDCLNGKRLIGMVQPRLDGALRNDGEPELCEVGCLGRVVSLGESGDGRYLISLHGICRFRINDEIEAGTPYRQCNVTPFLGDLVEGAGAAEVDRAALLKAFRDYLKANEMEADWESVSRADNAALVNALSMMSPYGPAEKQALLEAADLKTRAATLVAITEMSLAESDDGTPGTLQ